MYIQYVYTRVVRSYYYIDNNGSGESTAKRGALSH